MSLLLAISACKGWRPRQLDIKTTFLYVILMAELYLDLPEGSWLDGVVATIMRCIYRLKQSPREWNNWLVAFLAPCGIVITAWDLSFLAHEFGNMFFAIYLDDITLLGASGELKVETINVLKNEFKVNDMRGIHGVLGIQITCTEDVITGSQTTIIV
jgi:hypothetical protein